MEASRTAQGRKFQVEERGKALNLARIQEASSMKNNNLCKIKENPTNKVIQSLGRPEGSSISPQ